MSWTDMVAGRTIPGMKKVSWALLCVAEWAIVRWLCCAKGAASLPLSALATELPLHKEG